MRFDMKMLYGLFALLLLTTNVVAQGKEDQNKNNDLRYLLELTMSFGGDELGTIQYEDGDDQTISSGDGVTLTAGIDSPLPINSFGVKAALGYKISFSKASNADVKKSAIPLDIIPYYHIQNHKIGAGITYHINPTMDWDSLGSKWEFDNALGYMVEYSYEFTSLQLSAAYTIIEYEESSIGKFNTNHVSFKLSFLL